MDPAVGIALENDFAVVSVDDKIPLWKVFSLLNEAPRA